MEKHIIIASEKIAYPNPFDHVINICIGTDRVQKADMQVYDINGLRVHHQTFTQVSGGIQISLPNLKRGNTY